MKFKKIDRLCGTVIHKLLHSTTIPLFCICLFLYPSVGTSQAGVYEHNWPQWRGPIFTGEAPHADPPVRWDERTNVLWKTTIPGLGHATPVVWENHIFVLTAVPAGSREGRGSGGDSWGRVSVRDEQSFEVIAINRRDGSVIWRRVACVEAPHEGRHETASWASNSPVTNGEVVIASFGSRGIYCYDFEGNLKWKKNYGNMRIRFSWGEGSTPFLEGNRLVVQWDHDGRSFLAVVDANTGREIWSVQRNHGTSWATPLVVEHNGRKQIITSAITRSCSYDFETGRLLWETRGMTDNPVPCPVSANGVVYLMGGYRQNVLQAISLDRAKGNASNSKAVLWEYNRDTSYVPSPLLYRNALYFLNSNTNMLTALNATTGTPFYSRQRLDGITGVYASPVAANGRVYVAGRNGVTVVLRHGPKFEIIAKNQLNDRFDASPVIVGNQIILRGHDYLYCIQAK